MLKIREWFDKINETYYNVGWILVTIICAILAIFFGFATAEVLLGILLKSVTYSVGAITFLKASMGGKTNIMEKIEGGNVALAIVTGLFFAGLGAAIGGL